MGEGQREGGGELACEKESETHAGTWGWMCTLPLGLNRHFLARSLSIFFSPRAKGRCSS